MRFLSLGPAGAFLLGAAVLTGCASQPPAPAVPPAPASAVVQAPPPAPTPAPAPVAPAPLKLPADGTVAEFEGSAAELPESALALLDVVAKDTSTKRWEIKGYSDRKTVKNAREVALARGLAVRKALVERGIPAPQLRVMYSTDVAREAVTVLPR